jgi:hypothetical protein
MRVKESSLKKKVVKVDVPKEKEKVILRKASVSPAEDSSVLLTSFSNRNEACLYYPQVSRSWMPEGLIITPCLSEKGIKGTFDIEVFCSEKFVFYQLPDKVSKSVASEWAAPSAGGSHLQPTWKKNPKFTLKFKGTLPNSDQIPIRITLTKHGAQWKSMSHRDPVGCMIGLYIFITRGAAAGAAPGGAEEPEQIYESPFLPVEECSTEPSFTLPKLPSTDWYTIMPATMNEGKLGAFVLSVVTEVDFSLKAAT